MAKLKNKNQKLLFELILYPDPDSKSYEWVTYSLKISEIDGQNKELLSLSSSEEYTLYLGAHYEKEVLAICDGMLDVVHGKKECFFFEPIDEKDFQFEIKYTKKKYYVGIFSDDFVVLENYQWNYKSYLGIKMQVEKDDILDFVKQLKNEYSKIESHFPGKTYLPKYKK